ncbi:MAG TPA: ABC transporter ATP-binding protein [Anaerolineales bacterium]|nr:ABC transporter ATP-binding protein [Anaerolineales bacterium]
MAFLHLTNLRKTFATSAAVEDFNLEVEKGEFVSFLGPSGCGKTTTLRMIGGFEMPTNGAIGINGKDVTSKAPNQRGVGMVFQAYALFPNMTVAGNIGFGLKVAKRPAEEIRERVQEMLALIQMHDLGPRYPYQLSGGQQQRVALARALAIRPQVLLLDEPLSALDAKIRVELRFEIRRIQRQLGITTIYVTHDQEEALSLSDRVVVMNSGRIEQIGTPFEIYNYPKTSFVASFVGTLNQLRCSVVDAAAGKVSFDGQPFAASGPIRGADGSVIVMLRPEELHIGALEGQNQLRGTVETVAFLGAIVRMQVKLGEALVTLDALNERRLDLPKIGQALTLSFPPHACWVMGDR